MAFNLNLHRLFSKSSRSKQWVQEAHGHRRTTNSNIVAAVTKREKIPYYNMVVRLSWKQAIILSIFRLPTRYLLEFKKYIPTFNPPSMRLTRPEKGLNELGVGERLIDHPYPEECFLDFTTLFSHGKIVN